MRRPLRAILLLLVALAAGSLVAGCGSNSKGELLPGTTADQITANLDLVRESAENEDCEKAEEAVAIVTTEIDELGPVNKKLKQALKQGAAKLSEVVSTCGRAAEEAEEKRLAEEQTEEQEQLETEEEEQAEERAFEAEQKEQEGEEKAKEKAEKEAEQPEPPTEGEESNGEGKEKQEENETPGEEVTPPGTGGGVGGIGPSTSVEGGP